MVLFSEKNNRLLTVTAKPILIMVVLFIAGFFAPKNVLAATSAVRGAAWWGDTYHYVYFDCQDDVVGDRLDVEGNITTPPGFRFYSPPCVDLNHHVSINSNNNFSGQAWNSTLGLISFEGSATPPENGYGFNSNCPSTCNASNNCWACYNPTDHKVYGWARVDDTGEWIRLNVATTTPVMIEDGLSDVLPGHGILPGDFVGNASSTLGDLSFNCESETVGTGNCATRDYKVYISNLQLQNLSAPNWSYTEACNNRNALRAVLKWSTLSGVQAGFEIVVNDSPSFNTSIGNYVCWSGVKAPSVATEYRVPADNPYTDPNCQTLDYGTNYYWWIRLYYEEAGEYKPTSWYQYGATDDHPGLLDEHTGLIPDPDGNPNTFTTYSHEFPSPFFSWSPLEPLVGSSTDFTSSGSQFYASGNPLPQSCYGANCRYQWTTTDAADSITNPTGATTSISFFRATGTTVTLFVTDNQNYVCSTSSALTINYGLPIWREVKAE